jgi:putative hydrolase of the HAD superfamily
VINSGGLKAVFLDMDDTLCDTEGLTLTRLAEVHTLLIGEIPSVRLDDVIGQAAGWDPLGDHGIGRLPRLQRMSEALGLSDDQMARMRARYNEVLFENLVLGDRVKETLEWLRLRVKLGLITSGPSEFQRAKISTLGIGEFFDSITISGEVGLQKPDPELFRMALRSINTDPDMALYAGDRPKFDMEGSHAVGMTSVLVEKDYAYALPPNVAADFVIKDVTELPQLIHGNGWLSNVPADRGTGDRS